MFIHIYKKKENLNLFLLKIMVKINLISLKIINIWILLTIKLDNDLKILKAKLVPFVMIFNTTNKVLNSLKWFKKNQLKKKIESKTSPKKNCPPVHSFHSSTVSFLTKFGENGLLFIYFYDEISL
jgi:hypothetical protein